MEPAQYKFMRWNHILQWRSYIIAGAVALALVLLIALLISHNGTKTATEHCAPKSTMPDRPISKSVHSIDSEVMVNSSAYIQLFDHGFIELNLESISYDPNCRNVGVLSIINDCAELQIEYENNHNHLFDMKWKLRNADPSVVLPSCELSPKFDFRYEFNSRFSCLGRLAYNCVAKAKDERGNDYLKPIGQVVFETLEMEIGGDPAQISRGVFSRPPTPNGCRLGS